MPIQTINNGDKTVGLDGLNQWIREQEKTLGPITKVGDGGDKGTAGSFDPAKPRLKSKFATVSLQVAGQCVVDANTTLIDDKGQAYIQSVLMDVCLTRPK